MDPRDRRAHPRLEGEFPVDVLNMGDDPLVSPFEAIVPAKALDVSKQGMRLEAMYNVSVGTLLSAIVYYEGRESLCLCEVVWKREVMGKTLYGLFIKEWSKLEPTLQTKLSSMEKETVARAA